MARASTALALILAATATPTSATSHVHIRIHSAEAPKSLDNGSIAVASSSASNDTLGDGSLFGIVEKVTDLTRFRIDACAPQSWNVTRANATAVWLDFGAIDAPGDQIVVSALDGSQAQVFDVSPGGLSTKPIAGKGVKIEFRPTPANTTANTTANGTAIGTATGCAATGKLPSFRVESIGFGLPKQVTKESVCGANEQLLNTKCLSSALDNLENAVMRIATVKDGKTYFCTGWLWSSKGYVISNYHCLSEQAHVDQSHFEFGVAMPNCKDKLCEPMKCAVGETLAGKGNVELVKRDAVLDIAVLKITKDADKFVSKYKYLKIRDGDAKDREPFLLVQHPNGGPKVVPGILKTSKASIPVLSNIYRSDAGAVTGLGYMADTEGGSSGSPLISYTDKLVIGLHHKGGCPNRAVASGQLTAFLRANFGANDGIVKP